MVTIVDESLRVASQAYDEASIPFTRSKSTTPARLLGQPPRLRIDLHGRGHPSRQDHTLRHLIDVDAHRNALRQAHPGKDRVDLSQPLTVRLRVRDVDAAGDAADMAANDLAVAHQFD